MVMVPKETVVAYCPFTRAYLVRCAETRLLLLSTTQGKHELFQLSFKWEEKDAQTRFPVYPSSKHYQVSHATLGLCLNDPVHWF